MMNCVTLIGTEQVQSAASIIKQAADEMDRAANLISESLSRHERFMEEWLVRIEEILFADQVAREKKA